jgi:cholesterol oxidase
VYKHDNLNDATHNAIHEMFGIGSTRAFTHILKTIKAGKPVDKDGNDVYMPHLDRLKIPITFFHGAQNKLFLPEGSKQTLMTLSKANGPEGYKRVELANYAHMDFFIGKNAANDVFPLMVDELDAFNVNAAHGGN